MHTSHRAPLTQFSKIHACFREECHGSQDWDLRACFLFATCLCSTLICSVETLALKVVRFPAATPVELSEDGQNAGSQVGKREGERFRLFC